MPIITDEIVPDYIDYALLVDNSMYKIIRDVLKIVELHGLKYDHYFYISFDTTRKDVVMPRHLFEEYPLEMTVVLQKDYEDLMIYEDCFEVVLIFGHGTKERIVVPIKSVTSFFDPSVQFGLRFQSQFDITQDLQNQKNRDKNGFAPHDHQPENDVMNDLYGCSGKTANRFNHEEQEYKKRREQKKSDSKKKDKTKGKKHDKKDPKIISIDDYLK